MDYRQQPPRNSSGRRPPRFPQAPYPMHSRPLPPNAPPNMKQQGSTYKYKHKKSGASRYNDYLKKEEYKNKKAQSDNEASVERTYTVISGNALLSSPLSDDENLYLVAQNESEKADKKTVRKRKAAVVAVCFFLSLALNLLSIRIPLTPTYIKIEFTALPELVIALAVNPLIAVGTIIIKNLLYLLISPATSASILNKIILNSVFVLMIWMLNKLLSKRTENERATLTVNGIISSVITSLLSVLTFLYTIIPLKERQLSNVSAEVFKNYQEAFTNLCVHFPAVKSIVSGFNTLSEGLLFYNVPLNLFKYLFCTALAVILIPTIKSLINRK